MQKVYILDVNYLNYNTICCTYEQYPTEKDYQIFLRQFASKGLCIAAH